MSVKLQDIDQLSINIAKGLIMDTVRNANSGHTGGPLSSLDYTYILFKEFLKFDPDNPNWENRDRFVLSIGHESALLYKSNSSKIFFVLLFFFLIPYRPA